MQADRDAWEAEMEEFDALILYREHYKRMKRILPKFYRVLVGDPR